MRQYNNPSQPPTHAYSLGNPKPSSVRPGSNMMGGPGGFPAGMQNSFDTADLSSASIESELKRIETYLNADSTAYFKNLGITFSKPGKTKETGGFDTASFNTKENSLNTDMFRTPTKMPPLFEVNSDSQNREMYESEGQPNSIADSDDYGGGQDNAIIEQAIQRINERSHPFYKELQAKFDNQQEYINNMIDQRGSLPSNNQESEFSGEMDRIFGAEKTSPIANRNRSNSKYSNGGQSVPRFTASSIQTTADRTTNTQQTRGEQYNGNNYYDAEESVDNSRPREIQPLRQESFPDFRLAVKMDQVKRPQTQIQSIPSEPQSEIQDIDYFLKHLMIPRRMKISIDGVPFQEVIFVLALKFFEKSAFFENFVFEWLDVKSTGMIGYIKCDYIKYVYKQGQKRFNIACRDPRGSDSGEELLHYVHIEADTPEKCDLYVNGLNAVMKYMEKSTRNPMNKGT